MRSQIVNFLLEQQNRDGSWGFSPGKAGATEPTAYALMSLASEQSAYTSVNRGVEFLKKSQTPRGAWSISTQDSEEAAWATALAGLALLTVDGTQTCRSAADFIMSSFGKHPRPWILRLADWMRSFDASYVEENLRGWKWLPETANWVEPTAYALLFLKKFLRSVQFASAPTLNGRGGPESIIAEGELLLHQRVCSEGGWNYGNAKVLGEELRPYPLTSAIALIALQNPENSDCRRSLAYLQRAMAGERSALALCMAALCLNLYDIPAEPWMRAATVLYEETQFFRNIKTSAVALLALRSIEGQNAFRLATNVQR